MRVEPLRIGTCEHLSPLRIFMAPAQMHTLAAPRAHDNGAALKFSLVLFGSAKFGLV